MPEKTKTNLPLSESANEPQETDSVHYVSHDTNDESVNGHHMPITIAIVTYQPNLANIKRLLLALKPHDCHVVLIDNASKNQSDIKILSEDSSVDCIALDKNYGLGTAHNKGIAMALSKNSEYILLLDQDSLPDDNMVSVLFQEAEKLKEQNISFSAIGPIYYNDKNQHQSGFVKFGFMRFVHQSAHKQSLVEADFLISSGALIAMSAIHKVGKMNEALFIDHVDTEWFLRARHLGLKCFGSTHARMKHQLGEVMQRIWLGRWRMVPYHRAFRYYYIYRNSILLYKDKNIALKWKTADFVRLVKMFVVFALLSSKRKANFSMTKKGIIDGFRGVTGQLPD